MTCPTPAKRSHRTRREAKLEARRLKSEGRIPRVPEGARTRQRLHAYHCQCGAWHVGSMWPAVANGSVAREQAYG